MYTTTAAAPAAPAAAAVVRDALAGFASPAQLGRDELLDALTVLGDVQAVLDAVKLRVAGELVSRSVLVGSENPVHRAGHASPAVLVASGGGSRSRPPGSTAWSATRPHHGRA